jgi:hypothetical protein
VLIRMAIRTTIEMIESAALSETSSMARRRLPLELVICPENLTRKREKNRAALHERFSATGAAAMKIIANANGPKIINLYGGSLTENVIQATGRDVFADTSCRLEDADHTLVLTIHDEVLIEASVGTDPQLVRNIMAAPVGWYRADLNSEAEVLTHYTKK